MLEVMKIDVNIKLVFCRVSLANLIQSAEMKNFERRLLTPLQSSSLSPEIILSRMVSYSMTSPSPTGEFLAFDLSGGGLSL
jgi:hypothetical protein